MGKLSKRKEADLAWLKLNQLDITGELPGQLPLKDDGPGEGPLVLNGVPRECEGCHRRQSLEKGWSLLRWPAQDYARLMCGACGHTVIVTVEAAEQHIAAVRAHFLQLNAPKPKARPKRGRGAR
ncbi:MAG: hypothetical protein ACRDQZ_04735 [Mycobacteriales bacterium]